MSKLDYALKYAQMGLRVFPLAAGTKEPPKRFKWTNEATTHAEKIKTWWTNNPNYGVAVIPLSGGWAVIDVDVKNGATGREQLSALEAEHSPLLKKLVARTPSGGDHLVFKCAEPLGNHKIAPDIDIRCATGYIAVEPTVLTDGTAYEWLDWDVLEDDAPEIAELPQWVIDLSLAKSTKSAEKSLSGNTPTYAMPNDMKALQGRLEAFLNKSPKASARWWGEVDGLNDTSGSGMDFSMVALLKRGGFDYSEIVTILKDWPYGSTEGHKQGERYWQRCWTNTSEPERENDLVFGSEYQLAEMFAKENQNIIRWTNGLGWLANHGSHWVFDESLTRYTKAKEICRSVAKQYTENKDKKAITTYRTTNAVLSLAQSEEGIVTPIDAWDCEPMLLNTPGGVYDLTTGRRIERGTLLFRQVTTATPDTTQPTPVWDRFIQDVFSEDLETVEFIQRMAGYSLTGDRREQKLFFLHGAGANGKSVFIDALNEIMGNYAHNLPSEALMSQRNSEHPTLYADLFGKRLAISSEIEENTH